MADVATKAFELAQSGDYSNALEIEQALIREGHDVRDVHRFFNVLGNKHALSKAIEAVRSANRGNREG
jgi:hypothetical protein